MQMFESFLNSIPKNRSDMVSDLEIPDVTLSPYAWEPYDSLSRSDSLLTTESDLVTPSTDSSIPLSRAMTDSEIDYGRFRRYKTRCFSDPWDQMRVALDSFPPRHLESLNSFLSSSTDIDPELLSTTSTGTLERTRRYNEELQLKMERFFDECRAFTPDDPGLDALRDAIRDVDMQKIIDSELRSITP